MTQGAEYHLSVYEKSRGELLQSLSYIAYHPSAMTADSSDWTAPPDQRYIQPLHDGSLVCLRTGTAGLAWSSTFGSPVVGIFDVVFADGGNPQPVLFHHPAPPLPENFGALRQASGDAYVGRAGSDGTLYAMSRSQFPLIAMAGAKQASSEECTEADCLLGLHSLPGIEVVRQGEHSQQVPLGIDAASPPPPSLPSGPPIPQISAAPSRLTLPPAPTPASSDIALRIAIAIVSCAIVAFFWSKRRLARQSVSSSARSLPVPASSDVSEEGEEAVTPPSDLPQAVDFATYDKDLPPLPPHLVEGAIESDEEASEGEEGMPRKRKKRRGKRGKRPGQRAAAAGDLPRPVDNVPALSDITIPPPSLSNFDVNTPGEREMQVGSLNISDQVLGASVVYPIVNEG